MRLKLILTTQIRVCTCWRYDYIIYYIKWYFKGERGQFWTLKSQLLEPSHHQKTSYQYGNRSAFVQDENWQFVEDLRFVIDFETATIRKGVYFHDIDRKTGIEKLFVQPINKNSYSSQNGPVSLIVVSWYYFKKIIANCNILLHIYIYLRM